MIPRPAVAITALLLPMLIAASDPSGDVRPCRPGTAAVDDVDEAPDLVSATGSIVELGTSALWTLRFADALRVPDVRGTPFRVDLVLRDPSVPVTSFAYYHGLNRLVRYDAVGDPTLTILLLPERGQNVFIPPRIEGDTMTIQVPGRILSADEDETGTSPGLQRMRWGVIVRDGPTCDSLRGGRPTERFEIGASPSPSGVAPDRMAATDADGGVPAVVMIVIGALVIAGGGWWSVRGVRRRGRG